ncbi:hypothetical protein Tco_0953781 [Tanacetum coccineum]|uniref:Uncharacterized protein n=1 Tax=Tanacetum coccineum TaxID=301880 RepID=A0ABQ5E0U8_9ASTR
MNLITNHLDANKLSALHIKFPVLITNCINSTTDIDSATSFSSSSGDVSLPPTVKKKRKAYRRMRPGETEGITEEMRFIAMKLREKKLKVKTDKSDKKESETDNDSDNENGTESDNENENDDNDDVTWERNDGFLRYREVEVSRKVAEVVMVKVVVEIYRHGEGDGGGGDILMSGCPICDIRCGVSIKIK